MEWLDAARSGSCTLLVWFAFNSGTPALHRMSAEAGLNCSLNENSRSSKHGLTRDRGRSSQPSLRDSDIPQRFPLTAFTATSGRRQAGKHPLDPVVLTI
jgi:hypothetical protein